MRNFLAFIFCFLVFANILDAQTLKPFDEDYTQTVVEMKKYVSTLTKDLQQKANPLVKEFELYWDSEDIYEDQKEDFVETINIMIGRKLRSFQNFEAYTKGFMAATKCKQEDESYDAWLEGVHYIINNKSTRFVDYMNNSADIMLNGYLSKNNQIEWYSIDPAFTYKFSKGKDPWIDLGHTSIVGRSQKDSIVIHDTKATYFPISRELYLNGGKITWERAGFEPEKVYAKLKYATVDTRKNNITADSVQYHNPNYFARPLLGVLEDKTTLITDQDRVTYPRFRSYDKRIRLSNFFENVDFEGGVEMRGARFAGAGDDENPAYLIFRKEDKDFVKVSAENITLRKTGVTSSECRAYIFLDKDTIYHSSVEMKYSEEKKELILYRTKEGLSAAPFYDTYHKLDIYVESIQWNTDEELMEFKMLQGPGESRMAVFESYDFFDENRLNQVKRFHDENPLIKLYQLFVIRKTNALPFEAVVNHMGYAPVDVRTFLMEMAILGFIDYDINKDIVNMRPKMRNFLLANSKKQDYDIIQFFSNTQSRNNAKLNLMNFDMHVYGVKEVYLSDSQYVSVYPRGEEIIVKKNRDFEFNGLVQAGLFDFNASQCKFIYDNFKIEMNIIDSLMFYVEDKSQRPNYMGEYPLVLVKNSIQGVKGYIDIDEPNNKSSTKYVPEYPIYTSVTPGSVFFDKAEIHGGVYNRDEFYYRVLPFKIENLDDFETDSIEFNGYLVSGGIFEDIDKPLKVRDDFSLGFVHETGVAGMSIYGGKGKFTNTIDLSNRGLRGFGEVDYLTSKSVSNQMYFFIDSTNALLDTYEVKEQKSGIEYPSVVANDVFMHWEPYSDKMLIHSFKTPIGIFGETQLTGNTEMTPDGMKGAGELNFEKAQMFSDYYQFKHHEILSDTLDFNLKSVEFDDLAFKTYNQKSHIDLEKRLGNFTSNGEASLVEFPINLYKTNCIAFDWLMDKEEISIKYDDPHSGVPINITPSRELVQLVSTGNELISTHPAQEELSFCATKANYSLKTNVIETEGVRFIEVADSYVIPFAGKVNIYKNAEMQSFNNSRILTNKESQYHEIYDADIFVGSKNWYTGKGKINYVDELDITQLINVDTVYVTKDIKSIGHGSIAQESSFTLSPHFGFYGDVKIIAENEFFEFDGAVSISHGCDTIERAPMLVKTEVNPKEIMIPVSQQSKDINGRRIANAVVSAPDGRLYSAFASSKERVNDPELVDAFGYMTYMHDIESYAISNMEKLADTTLPGNILYLDKKNCVTRGEGKINIGARLGRMEMLTFGHIESFMLNDSAVISTSATLDFLFDDDLLKLISDYIQGSFSLEPTDIFDDENYQRSIIEIMGADEGEKALDELFAKGQWKKIPAPLLNTFYFSDIKLKWSPTDNSFISEGDIGIAMMGKEQINKYVPGILEIQKKRNNDELNLYLDIDGTWFHFWFRNNSMQVFSWDLDFNKKLMSIDSKKRFVNAKDGKPKFEYRVGRERSKKNLFKRLGIEEEEEDDE
ncbi:MAG: hypothetical protein ACOXZK_05430 [Bacteroidales bacterium]